ncbi:TraR/DksA C4-type zinc finger protein [Patescibacteria group bacterium]|nr:TraR/DksA C4-type zinc finger protein [Patescibacteria group bacterium]
MLTKEFIAESKEKLLKEKSRLEGELKRLNRENFGDDVDHGEENAEKEEQVEDNQGVATDYNSRLVDIDTALEKIREDTYGRCENCHKEISPEMLRVDPESRLCRDCKLARKDSR